ncbi:MAG: hypothetical protein AAB403_09715 [Planctomycetota bacterium]
MNLIAFCRCRSVGGRHHVEFTCIAIKVSDPPRRYQTLEARGAINRFKALVIWVCNRPRHPEAVDNKSRMIQVYRITADDAVYCEREHMAVTGGYVCVQPRWIKVSDDSPEIPSCVDIA